MDTERDVLSPLNHVTDGTTPPEGTLLQLKPSSFEDLSCVKMDHHRSLRQGVSEVIYGQSKTPGQITGILGILRSCSCKSVLITRIIQETADLTAKDAEVVYEPLIKLAIAPPEETEKHDSIVMATGDTNDTDVAEEVALTIGVLGNSMMRIHNVGVAGLHRLLSNLEPLMTARVVIAVVGMEGALASVIGGLAGYPVVTVPTSIGYGTNFGGVMALLSMLNSRTSGVSVVNIDNEFNAGYLVS